MRSGARLKDIPTYEYIRVEDHNRLLALFIILPDITFRFKMDELLTGMGHSGFKYYDTCIWRSNGRVIQVASLMAYGVHLKDIQFHLFPGVEQICIYRLNEPLSEIDMKAKLQSIIEPIYYNVDVIGDYDINRIRSECVETINRNIQQLMKNDDNQQLINKLKEVITFLTVINESVK